MYYNVVGAPYDSGHVANAFIDIAQRHGELLTPLKLLKLVYIAHGWYLAVNDRALITDTVEAWQFGPVIPSLYAWTRPFRKTQITSYYTVWDPERKSVVKPMVNEDDYRFLQVIWRVYGQYSARELSELTHSEGSPWAQVYRPGVPSLTIPQDVIKQHYTSRAA